MASITLLELWASDYRLALGCLGWAVSWGAGPSLVLLSPRRMHYLPVISPIVGCLLVTYLTTLLSYLGTPIGRSAGVISLGLALISLMLVASKLRVWIRSGELDNDRLVSLGREAVLVLVVLALVLLIPAAMASDGGAGRLGGFWGSGDIFPYTLVIDYLRAFAGNPESYHAQDVFFEDSVAAHLETLARLGSMCLMALFAELLSPQASQAIFLPVIGLGSALLLLLARLVLHGSDLSSARWIPVASLHPFVSFLAYFTYAGQALSVPLVLGVILLIDDFAERPPQQRRQALTHGALLALILAGAIVLYPVATPFLAVFGAIVGGIALLQRRTEPLIRLCGVLVAGLALAAFYLPRVVGELIYAATRGRMGWDWQGPIGFGEVFGLQPVSGYRLPNVPLEDRLVIECLLLPVLALGLVLACRTPRARRFLAVVVVTTSVIAAAAVAGLLQGRPLATHSLVKAVSQATPLLFVAVLAGWDGWLGRRWPSWKAVPRWAMAGLLVVLLLRAALAYERQLPWYGADLVELVAEELGSPTTAARLVFLPGSRWPSTEQATAVVRSKRRLQPFTPNALLASYAAGEPLLFASYDRDGASAREIARRGPYWLGDPPRDLTIAEASELPPLKSHHHGLRAWSLQGRNELPGDQAGCLDFVLSTPGNLLRIEAHWAGRAQPGSLQVEVSGHLTERLAATEGPAGAYALRPIADKVQKLGYSVASLCWSPDPADEPETNSRLVIESLRFATLSDADPI